MNHSEKIQIDLTQEQLSFLENFGERCESPTGSDISKESVLRCLLRLFREVKAGLSIVLCKQRMNCFIGF